MPGIRIVAPSVPESDRVLTPDALAFVEDLSRRFRPRVSELLQRRKARQARFDAGERPNFLSETANVRSSDWRVAPIPSDLMDRRVEITGPVDRKMIINALNSPAQVFMADFEDSNAPTWANQISGQSNLMDAVRRSIEYVQPETGKRYSLVPKIATLMVRPRGWHLTEAHVLVDDQPIPGSLFDFGLFFFHNAQEQVRRGTGPYFYLPKMQSHLEARLWNDVFLHAQRSVGLPSGTIRATVLIETLPAAFEMDEILYELREHSVGLNCGRWDYIFSSIKTLRSDPGFVLPDRGQVTMEVGFLRSYTQLLIRTCHRRGAHAMGGMAAQIPIKSDPQANDAALAKVKADKQREAKEGHDGTWVAHPGLIETAKAEFDRQMPTPNQISKLREDVNVTAAMLIEPPAGTRTEAGLRHNIRVGIQYLEAWLGGLGCVPLYNLMEDAATAEISRTQIWQWLRHGAALDDGRRVTRELVQRLIPEELTRIRSEIGAKRFDEGHFDQARSLFERVSTAGSLEDFLTVPAYETLIALEKRASSSSAPSTLLDLLGRNPGGSAAVVIPEQNITITYAGLKAQVEALAESLAGAGVRRGDRVGMALPNGLPTIVSFLAASMAGTAAPLNPAYREEEFKFYLDDTAAKVLLLPPDGAEAARKAAGDTVRILTVDMDAQGVVSLQGASGRVPFAPPSIDDTALILHTSGSTGRPKRVPLTHANITISASNVARTYALTSADVSLCVMPLFHVHGLVASVLATFATGGTVVVPAKFNPLSFWRVAHDHKATWYSAVPTLHQLLLARVTPGASKPAGAERLRFIRSCSASLAPQVMHDLEAAFGAPVLEAYGMTEAAHQMASNPLPPSDRKPGSVGPGTGVRISIMDDKGGHLPMGERGEVVIQGMNVIRGYENNPEANATSFTDGWFRTGDQGFLDESGYLTLVGRLKELINRGGEKISPREIDEVLLAHPKVAEAVCFGTPHPTWGEEVAAAVVVREPVTDAELQAYCKERLAEFKRPKQIFVTQTIPRTATGKIQRRIVAQAFANAKP